MTLPTYDDRSPNAVRAIQPWGHGPVMITRRYPEPLTRAWCLQCVTWVGPDRTGDEHALRLVEDDAVAHAHAIGANCGHCEACLPDGAIYMGELAREAGKYW
jgi:hypothetical protein